MDELENAELDAEWLREDIKYLESKIELLEEKLSNRPYIGIDNNAYAYWLCHTDLDGNLQDLLENIQLYGGIK